MKTYIIAFTLKQRGNKTQWIESILQSGIREGESITNFQLVDITEYIEQSQKLTEDNDK